MAEVNFHSGLTPFYSGKLVSSSYSKQSKPLLFSYMDEVFLVFGLTCTQARSIGVPIGLVLASHQGRPLLSSYADEEYHLVRHGSTYSSEELRGLHGVSPSKQSRLASIQFICR